MPATPEVTQVGTWVVGVLVGLIIGFGVGFFIRNLITVVGVVGLIWGVLNGLASMGYAEAEKAKRLLTEGGKEVGGTANIFESIAQNITETVKTLIGQLGPWFIAAFWLGFLIGYGKSKGR